MVAVVVVVAAVGPPALTPQLGVSPRIGHIHVTVDDASWVWADASGEPVIINGLQPCPHKILVQLESANHQLLDQGSVMFKVPESLNNIQTTSEISSAIVGLDPPAKIIIDSPLAEPLSRGVVFIQYRTGNLHIVPVYGPAALVVSPRIGHIHITVEDAT